MDPAKITLSPHESALVQNAGWLLTKNSIIGKVYLLFGQMAEEIKRICDERPGAFPEEVWSAPAKISRGENYKGLPYNILDYPRLFGKEDIFAIRTMFWWGNFFSVTIHLKGKYKFHFMPALKMNWPIMVSEGFYISAGENEWRHDFEPDHYKSLALMDPAHTENMLEQPGHCKLAVTISLDQWNRLSEILPAYYRIIFDLLRY